MRRALLSVSDKSGIEEFAQGLLSQGVALLSTGGTRRLLADGGIAVTEVSAHTGFPEIMDGRVKTLHPKIHGGILARRGNDESVLQEHGIDAIDLVAVNLYPFEQTIADPDCTLEAAIENIDIGGPAMLRAAAKNHRDVVVVVQPEDYAAVLDEMRENDGAVSEETRFELASRAFAHTARYDAAIANYLDRMEPRLPSFPRKRESRKDNRNAPGNLDSRLRGNDVDERFPPTLRPHFTKIREMRYGENPHQSAALYVGPGDGTEPGAAAGAIATAQQLQGKELSYNNIADADAALECVKTFTEPACVIVKHANPCGVAVADNLLEAYRRAFATDPESAFGGVLAFNRELDAETAAAIIDGQFAELIIAPAISGEARAATSAKKNLRVLVCGNPVVIPAQAGIQSARKGGNGTDREAGNALEVKGGGKESSETHNAIPPLDFKTVSGGLLVQERDLGAVNEADLKVVTRRQPAAAQMQDLLFAWKVAKFVKSNAIVYAGDGRTIGIGAGQMSRVNSARIALIKAEHAGLEVKGAVMASDAFFPFRDGIDNAAKAGIAAVIQPGGSMRDEEVIAAANEHNMSMVFTGMRHFRH